jgi:hypothetical protein
MSAHWHVGLAGPSSLADSFLLPGRFPRLVRAATSFRSHQRGFRLLYPTGHWPALRAALGGTLAVTPHWQPSTARPSPQQPSSTSLRALGGFIPAAGRACFLCHSPLSRGYYTAVRATGYTSTPRSVGSARHLDTLLPASSVTAHCRGATNTAVRATGYTPRSVGPARHLYKFLSSSPRRVWAPLLRHPPEGAVKLGRSW